MRHPPASTTAYCAAIEARDPAAVAEACTPDVVFNSPISSSVRFEGREDLAELFRSALEVYDELRCVEEFGSGDRRLLYLRSRIGDQELEEVQVLRLDGWDQVREIIMFARPLPA